MRFRVGRGAVVLGAVVCLVALAPLSPSPAAAAGAFKDPFTYSRAAPHDVVIRDLPAVTPSSSGSNGAITRRPLLVRDPVAYAAGKASTTGPQGKAVALAAPNAASVSPLSPTLSVGFAGLSLADDLAIGVSGEPPDTQVAAGPTAVLELINIVGRVYSKTGTALGPAFSLRGMFGLPGNVVPFDPRVLFDSTTNRWYASVVAADNAGNSQVVVAVSASSDPAGGWHIYPVYSAAALCDQPKLGYSSDKLVIACTDFVGIAPNQTFLGGVIVVAEKSQGLAGVTMAMATSGPHAGLFGVVPAQNMSPGVSTAYAVQNQPTDAVHAGLITITGDPAAGTVAYGSTLLLMPMPTQLAPPAVEQGAGNPVVDSGDDRFMSAVVQGQVLWTTATTKCTPLGDIAGPRSCILLLTINLSSSTVGQDFVTGVIGKYLYYPTLALDANGNAVIDYSESSSTEYPSHGVIFELAGQTALSGGAILQAGTGTYTGQRWGDYGAAATDPTLPTRVWFAGEYSTAPTSGAMSWGTGIGEVVFTDLTLNPTGLGFGQLPIGATSAAQGVTVTNTGGLDVQVSAALNTGSTDQFHVVDNSCASVLLAPAATCTAHFTFDPTTAGDKEARFNVSGPNFGPLALVLTGIGLADACASTAISPGSPSPQIVGTPVTLSATSLGCPDANPLYKFLLRSPEGVWTTVHDFSTAATFVWDTTGYEKGTYLIGVWVKDANSTNTYDAYAFGTFTLGLPTCSSVSLASDIASPQTVGVTVNFTATSIGCPSPLYQWFVRDIAGNWNIVTGHDFAHSSNTFAWNTTGLPDGTYQVGVWAKQTGSTNSYDAFAFVTYTLTVTHCTAVNLGTSMTSPQAINASITLTPTVTGCGSPQYRFYVRDAAGTWHIQQDFGVGTTYVWNSSSTPVNTTAAGTFLLGVWAKQTGSANSYDAFAFITFSLTSGTTCTVNIGADKTSPQPLGTTATWTATAANCPVGPLKYQFWVNPPNGTWGIVQPFSTTNTFVWTGATAGTYQVGVWVKQANSTAAYDNFAFTTFTLTGQVCGSVGVTSDVASPQLVGATVTFTAAALGCSSPQYQWWVRDTSANWAIVQDFAHSSATLAWNTTGLAPGTYLVGVWARQTGSTASYEAYSFVTYTLTVTPAQICSSVGISPSVASPQVVGTSITFTATALGCSTPNYRFFIAPPSTGIFAQVQPFGPANTLVWDTSGLAPGPYQVGVWARQQGSSASYEAFAFITFQIQSASTPCAVLDLNTNPQGQLPPKGTTVTIFASAASGCASPVYQFYLRSPGSSSFVVLQAYSPSAQFNFVTGTAAQGAYTFLVLSEDATSPGPPDTYAETDFQLT